MMINGTLKFPGDKSISHRALILASLSDGKCEIENISTGVDVESTRQCLALCGIQSTKIDNKVLITGGRFYNPATDLDCGNSGTSARLLIGLLSGQKIKAKFVGDKSLSQRPMQRVIEPLMNMEANIESLDQKLPISLNGNKLSGISYTPKIASAQVKSAILLAGLGADGETKVTELHQTRDHTELMLNELCDNIFINNNSIKVTPLNKPLRSFDMTVPGDPSTAAFFAAAAVLLPNSNLVIENISANPKRTGFYTLLERMGGNLEFLNQWKNNGELAGNMQIRSSKLHAVEIKKDDVPSIIDELPILAILATQADGITNVRGAAELRVKESDRISAICRNLIRMGANVMEFDDGFTIEGPTKLNNADIKTFDDHRIAMAFTIAGLVANVQVVLDNPDCVSISFPEFYSFLKKVM